MVEKAFKNLLDLKRYIIQRMKFKFFQASHKGKFRNVSFQLFSENKNLSLGKWSTQNSKLHFTFQLALEGRKEGLPRKKKKKKLDWYLDSTKRKTKVPDDYDDRNIPEVDICQETDLWQ